jgi:hypothetical protein
MGHFWKNDGVLRNSIPLRCPLILPHRYRWHNRCAMSRLERQRGRLLWAPCPPIP